MCRRRRTGVRATSSAARAPPATVRVFIDCPDGCDGTYLRTELKFVDHVLDREVADVHILVTERGTGGGGTEFTVSLIGLKRFASRQETLKYASQPGDTDDAERLGVLRVIKLGLVRYVSQTPLGSTLDVQVQASQYIPEFSSHRLSLEGDAEIRLFKGSSLNVGAAASLIPDQVCLPAGEASQEEVLLRLRQIATSYDYGFSIGFSYSFGSVYNNVVNSRLSGF